MKLHILAALATILLSSGTAVSQRTVARLDQLAERLHALSPPGPESSVYLQSDKEIYGTGEDLWFHAFILNKKTFMLSEADQTLFVELTATENDSTVWSEMYPINSGLSAGQVHLQPSLEEGEYLLKAYAAHSVSSGQGELYAVKKVKVVKEFQSVRKKASPAAVSANDSLTFQVFPEGGYLVAGQTNNVAFKAVNRNGHPQMVSGELLGNDKPILRFTSTHAGMGKFSFRPERHVEYRIRLQGDRSAIYPVPQPQDSGIILQLARNTGDRLILKIASGSATHRPVYIRLQSRGVMVTGAAGLLKDSLFLALPVGDVPQGLAEVTVFDEQLRPMAERLVFLHQDRNLKIRVNLGKDKYASKEKVSLHFVTTDADGKPVPAVLSLRVRDQVMGEANGRNIVSYFQLSTQLRGRLHDPSYYFDTTHADRHEALDLLLMTQGWRRYVWNETSIQERQSHRPVMSDSLQVTFAAVRKSNKETVPSSVMLFRHDKSNMQAVVPGTDGRYILTPDQLITGSRFFIKYFSDHAYKVSVTDPFAAIRAMTSPVPVPPEWIDAPAVVGADTAFLQYGKRLQEVTITGKGRGFSDKFFGYLDSIAKYEGNFDYVGQCGILNCPACHSGSKPVEGRVYSEFKEEIKSKHATHPIPFTANDIRRVTYHYPTYTEEELMTKFKMIITKGYFQSRAYYEPDYDREDKQTPDARNVIAWKPAIVTNERGEATVSFYTSDLKGRFVGVVEGVDGAGLMGAASLSFFVTASDQ